MYALDLSTNQQYPNRKPIANRNSSMRNQISNSYNDVLASVAATRKAFAERLQRVLNVSLLLYTRMMDYIAYGQERIIEVIKKKECRRWSQFNTLEAWKSIERILQILSDTWGTKSRHRWLYWSIQTTSQSVNWGPSQRNAVFKSNNVLTGKMEETCKISY